MSVSFQLLDGNHAEKDAEAVWDPLYFQLSGAFQRIEGFGLLVGL